MILLLYSGEETLSLDYSNILCYIFIYKNIIKFKTDVTQKKT